ncbi:MAG TPA: SusC/RagA family TonB-linked outer membrane protein, partial [Sphingobacteriaceae bacterium]|nr:SusC/RagA family TonB-linked outer membrane protein [Sphingobacteriaceae bacterium]
MMSFDTKTLYQLNASRNYETWTQIIDPNLQDEDGRDQVYYTKIGGENTPLSMSSGSTFESFSNFQFMVNYNRLFSGKHQVTGLLMAQQEQRIRPGDRLPFNLRGVSSRVTYGYHNLYFAEFNAGYNGSEQFAKGKRYGFFPSVSASWVASNEAFMQDISFMDLLKFRGSYGQVGNDRLGSKRFLYLDDIQRVGGGYSPSLGVGATISESYIGNPDIKWEIADKFNIGLEIGLLQQFNLTVDVFKEKRSNVLISRGMVPMLTGIVGDVRPPVNIGIVENKGYEIELKYNKQFANSLSLFSNINFNRAKNKVVFMDEPILSEDYAYRYRQTGYSIGQHFGYIVDGYFNSPEEISSYMPYEIGRSPRPGDFKYRDVNGDGKINDRDMAPIGHSVIPEYTYGAAFGVSYKGFSISALFQGVANVSTYLSDIGVYETYDFRERMLHAWTPERYAAGEEILYPALSTGLSSSNNNNSFYLENTSFVRLKNAEVGYEFSTANWMSFLKAQSFRVYVNGMNLFTWDKMRTKDYDPEISNSFTYPVYRVFNAGVNIIF